MLWVRDVSCSWGLFQVLLLICLVSAAFYRVTAYLVLMLSVQLSHYMICWHCRIIVCYVMMQNGYCQQPLVFATTVLKVVKRSFALFWFLLQSWVLY